MRNYKHSEIVKLTELEIDAEIKNNSFDFLLNSKVSNIENLTFRARVIDIDLAENNLPFNFVVIIKGETEKKEIYILNVSELNYINT